MASLTLALALHESAHNWCPPSPLQRFHPPRECTPCSAWAAAAAWCAMCGAWTLGAGTPRAAPRSMVGQAATQGSGSATGEGVGSGECDTRAAWPQGCVVSCLPSQPSAAVASAVHTHTHSMVPHAVWPPCRGQGQDGAPCRRREEGGVPNLRQPQDRRPAADQGPASRRPPGPALGVRPV